MGDWFQTVVDRDATGAEAMDIAKGLRDWLVSKGIVCGEMTDCVLGGNGMGYAPGARLEHAIDGSDHGTRGLRTNGLHIAIGRTVFHSGQGGWDLICRQCKLRFDPSVLEGWGTAIEEWYQGEGPGALACPQCGHSESVAEWTHDPPWGFGNLGFEFWNWPRLKKSFVDEIARRLGHRTVFVAGKL